MFGFSPFADSAFSEIKTSSPVITGVLNVQLDDVSIEATGTNTHSGVLNVQLDDVSIEATGTNTHSGVLNVQLDDVSIEATGTNTHSGVLNVQLDDVSIDAIGVVGPQSVQLTRGGYPKKKIKNERKEVERSVEKAINKALGIVEEEPEKIVKAEVALEKAPDFTNEINELVLEAQKNALDHMLAKHLEEMDQDDEEAILLFL